MPVTGLIAFSDAEPAEEEESYISKRDRVAARDEKANLAAPIPARAFRLLPQDSLMGECGKYANKRTHGQTTQNDWELW